MLLNLNKCIFVISFFVLTFFASSIHSLNETQTHHDKSLSLEERIDLQKNTVHWLPYQKILYSVDEDGKLYEICPERESSIEDFYTIMSRETRLQGWITFHFIIAIYFFIMLAFVCDKYFIPAVERICEALNITQDVAASTFMATATTMPEFFTNTISIFITESDMGLGAIVGSMLFNTLGVAACASLFAKKTIQIDWWPVTRDSIVVSINICVLVAVVWDSYVMWYETIVLLSLYIGYWVLMFQSPRLMRFFKNIVEERLMWCQRIKNYDINNQRPYPNGKPKVHNPTVNNITETQIPTDRQRESYRAYNNNGFEGSTPNMYKIENVHDHDLSITPDMDKANANGARGRRQSTDLSVIYNQQMAEDEEDDMKLWEMPRNATAFDSFWFFFTWPIRFVLTYTIPSTTKHKKLFPLTFFMCILWIGGISYIVFWMVVIIGYTFGIPEAVMGFTLLGFGGCMPEAISAVIVVRKGSGQMGVSNSLGANSLAVLFSLGLPWFIRTMADGAWVNNASVNITSLGIQFTILGLLVAVATLYAVLASVGYKLRKTSGVILAMAYLIFATLAVLSELDIIFESERC